MKNLITYLTTLWGSMGNLQSSDVSHDCRLTVGSPSGFNSKRMLKLVSVLAILLTVGVGNVWGAGAITVTSSAITLPNGSTTVGKGAWMSATGESQGYWSKDVTVGSYGTITCSNAGDQNSTDYLLQLQASGGYIQTTINSPAGVDITIGLKKGSSGTLTVSLTGATNKTYTSTSWGSLSISTTNTSATLKVTKTGSKAAGISYITITPKAAASCTANPTVGNAANNGALVYSTAPMTVPITCPSIGAGSASCSIKDYGFVWKSGGTPTISDNKTQIGTDNHSTAFSGNISGTFAAGTTYYVKAYAINNGDNTTLSSGTYSFTPRSITFNSNGGSSVPTILVISGQAASQPADPTKDGYTFGGWYSNEGLTTPVDWSSTIGSNKTYYAKWIAEPTITVSETSRAFGDRKVNGGPYNMTFNVSGQYLTGNISLAITGTNAGMFSVNKTSLTPSTGTVATTEITVSYSPTGAGSHTATLTISSDGATSKTVALTGTGKWEVTWSVNGGETTSLVANGTKPTLPSPAPSSCDATSTTFMGWATSSWPGKLDDVSDKTIHTSNSTMDNVTANGTTFYAVFAKATGSDPTPATLEFSYASHTGWTIGGSYSDMDTYSYYRLNSVSGNMGYVVSPTISDMSTITSIDVYAAYYGGSSYGKFKVYGGATQYGSEQEPSNNSRNKYTLSPATNPLSGSGSIKIICSGTSYDAAKGTRLYDVVINYTTGGISYSEYLTTCVACTSDPDMTSAASALKGVFSSSSVGVTATDWSTGSAYCSWADYGFVWGTSANPTVSDTKVQVGTSGSVTTWDGNLTGSFAVNTTYHYRAYGKNSKDGATIQYSSDQTFTPRNVTFNLNGHGESAPSTQFVNNGSKATDPSYSEVVTGWAFGGWYKEEGCTNAWNFASDVVSGESKTLYAKWTEKPKYTITLNAGNGTISDVNWTNTSGSTYTRTQANGDEEITLPTPSCNCAGWVFQGWSTTSKDNAASFTPDKADGASFAPTSNVTYYAVYRQSTQTGTTYTKITTAGEFTTGDYAIVAYSSSLSNYYAMGNSTSSSHMTETTAAADSWTNSTANYIWTVIKVGDYVAFYNADAGKFLTIVDGAWELATDGQKFSYSFNSTTKAWTFTAPSGKQMIYSSYFYVGDAQNNDIYLYKRGSAASGNYYTSPSCSDYSVTGVASPAAGGTVYLTATAAKNGDDIWATYTSDEDYNFTRWEVSGTGASITSTTAEFTKLTMGAADATVTAVFTAKDWKTITWKSNGSILSGGDLGSASVKVENGDNITTLPPDPTSCETGSGKSDVFMGWSTTEWSGYKNDDEFPDGTVIYASAAAMPTVTDNVTYYACWAQAGSTPTSYTLDFAISSSVGSATAFTAFKTGLTNAATNNTYWDADNITTTNIVYQDAGAAGQVGPRLGSGSNTGTITMPLLTAGQVAPTSITVRAKRYSSDASSKLTLTVYYTDDTNESKDLPSGASSYLTADFDDYTANFTSGKTINKIVIQTKTSGQRAYIASITVTANAMEKYLTKCCDDPELAFTYTGEATAEELVRENKARLDAADEVVLTYTTSSSGTITDPTSASVYKLTTGGDGSGYGSRATTGGSGASAQVDAISIDKTNKKITLSIKNTNSNGTNTGCGTYRVELYQAAYNSGGDNYCEKTAYGFVDVKIKYEFIDAVNGNTTVVKYNTGSGVLFPTAGELSGGSNCHSETRVLKGWISETKLTSLYGGSAERVLTLDDVKDAANTIVAPGADGKGIYAQGTKWYAVWAYEK